jgi:hypothetical protein
MAQMFIVRLLFAATGGWPGHEPDPSSRVPHPRVGRVGLGFRLSLLHSGTISIPTSSGSAIA